MSFRGFRSYQRAFLQFSAGHLRGMNFEGGKRIFPICPKCNISTFFPQHILQCLGFSCEEAVASPLLFLDFVQIYGLMDLNQMGISPTTTTSVIKISTTYLEGIKWRRIESSDSSDLCEDVVAVIIARSSRKIAFLGHPGPSQ
ncbi:uncharacterized protein TNCV_2033251 [Trichonephila clavipes]|nr:uncharacterized protein TNCV_2033251 [Trichonephila clavipes]